MSGPLEMEWNSYAREVVPADAPEVQRIETRRAFYAGAQGLMSLVMSALSPGPEPSQEDIDFMSALQRELRAFHDDVVAGRA